MAAKRRRRLKPASPAVGGGDARYPFVAIVGRPNVGKSTLFNRILGQRIAIEEPTAGTTRDRIAAVVELEDGRVFELCDTGGLGGTGDAFDRDVNRQIDLAVEYADVVVLLVDARAGLLPLDEQIARRLKRAGKPIVLAANKAETSALEAAAGEFYALGVGDVHCVSAKEGTGRSDLLDAITEHLPPPPEDAGEPAGEVDPAERVLRVAIVGRRNVGKSTYVNRLFGGERVIASETPGTTRDAIDVRVQVGERELVLIDTAGLRKRGRADDFIEVISHGRAERAVRRSDVVLLFLDCLDEIGNVDKKIAGMVADEHKACVIVANKWDLVQERMTAEVYADYATKLLPGLAHCPLVTISAREGLHDAAPIELAHELYRQSLVRAGTGELNRALAGAIALRRPKAVRGRLGKVYFGTQVATNPVTVLLFVNDPALFQRAWRRYLAGQLRKALPWPEVPVKLVFRGRQSLMKRGGRLARQAKALGGLAEQVRWVDDQPTANVVAVEASLDGDAVQEALRDVIEATGEDEDE